jgi:hypothetical protein
MVGTMPAPFLRRKRSEHADGVRNGLDLVQIEQPVHASGHRRCALYFGARARSVGLKILVK